MGRPHRAVNRGQYPSVRKQPKHHKPEAQLLVASAAVAALGTVATLSAVATLAAVAALATAVASTAAVATTDALLTAAVAAYSEKAS